MNELDAKINKKKKEMLEFLKTLVSIPTINPPGDNYNSIVDIIKKELGKDFKIEVYTKNGKPNLLVRWSVGSKKTLHVNNHFDVVPVSNNWKHKPFEPTIEDGKLFGRGSADSKSNACTLVYALKIMKEAGMKPTCNVECSFTCDEESGGIDGLGYLVKENIVKPNFGIVLDGPVKGINNGHKGVLALNITVIGKGAHAAWPHRGENAFLGACKLAQQLNDLNKELGKLKSKCDTKEEIEKTPTLVPGGKAEGGLKFNSVPDKFSFTIDRRIIPEEKIEDAKRQITKIVDKFCKDNPAFRVNVDVLLEAQPAFVDKNCKISRILAGSIKIVKGKEPDYFLLPGFLDMRHLVNDAKVDCVNYGTNGANEHGDDEFVYINSIFENIKILILTFMNKKLCSN